MKPRACLLALAISLSFTAANAQLRSTPFCPPFNTDILDGTVSRLFPQSPHGDIKNRLPCFTDATDELSEWGCGGVFFKDRGVYFYTYRDYIEIRENYQGTMTVPLMGAHRNSLFKWLGLPRVKDVSWEAYQMKYGSLVVFVNAEGKVNRIIISSKSPETLRLCE
jgi:hypothetical protein